MLVTVILLAGLAFGCLVGARYAHAKRSWATYRTARKAMPNLRKSAWSRSGKAAWPVLALVAVAVIALYAAGHR
jgi:hypothetical protein